MALINENYIKLPANYLFKEIARKLNVYKATRPNANLVRLDSGDSTHIVKGNVVDSLLNAVKDMAEYRIQAKLPVEELTKNIKTRIIKVDYENYGVSRLTPEEIFLCNNAMDIASSVCDLFSNDNVLAFLDPSYPAYIYSAVMAGRAGEKRQDGRWSNFVYVPCNWSNNFLPDVPKAHCDVIYLNLPHNPTGTMFTRDKLKEWVKYAAAHNAIIIYDASHSHYITEKDVPHSIYEIRGAKKVAVEIRSFSKTTGFTGTNFAYLTIPKELSIMTLDNEEISLNTIWQRRQITTFSGIPYLTLCSADALYSDEGVEGRKKLVEYYMGNAALIRNTLVKLGFKVQGGVNSPYVWMKLPNNTNSWNFFERLLYEANVVCSPGVGFCPGGEGAVRFTGFSSREDTQEAMNRIVKWKK
ncbi:MAG: LL-diaminopimelate aminotransferase [Paludibacteraceae bacterium]|nr:LL-diaminopimelate aminotransferase [Paludibacteraceae bacterium]